MQKKNRRQQRTKRVGGAGGVIKRYLAEDPYIVQFVGYYADAGISKDKPKHQDRFIQTDKPQLKEYFKKLNQDEYTPNNSGEIEAVKKVKELFSNKKDFLMNYGVDESDIDSAFTQKFMELAPVVNPDSFISANPMAKDAYFSKANDRNFSEVNPMIVPKVPIEQTGNRIARNPLTIPTRGDKIPAAQKELDDMEATRKEFEEKRAEANKYYDKIDQMGKIYEARKAQHAAIKSNFLTPSNSKSDANILADSQYEAAANLKEMEAERSEGGSKKSRRRRNQRRNQRRNRSRKQ